MELAGVVTDAAIDSGVYKGYDYFTTIMRDWQADLRRWRCSLSNDEVVKLRGTLSGWNCADLTFTVGRVSFEDAGKELKAELDKVPTRFKLDPQTLETVISAGETALRNNAVFRSFIRKGPRRALTASIESSQQRTE
jgi:NTE family protein